MHGDIAGEVNLVPKVRGESVRRRTGCNVELVERVPHVMVDADGGFAAGPTTSERVLPRE
jgi:hypothetical protein